MKIVILHFGGASDYSNLFINSTLSSNDDIYVFAPLKFKQNLQHITQHINKVHFYKKPRMRSLANITCLRNICDEIEKINPDVIHFLELYPWMHFFLRRLSAYRLILTIHDPVKHSGDIESRIMPDLPRRFYKFISHFVVLGKLMKKDLIEKFGINESRISVLPHGTIDSYLDIIPRPETRENIFNILFFGRLYKYKGVEYLIDAEPVLSESISDFQITIAGSGNRHYVQSLKNHIVNKQRFIIYNEYISDRETARLFNEADVVILPYTDATQSGVLMIAYSFGKPVIVTDVGSLPEYVQEGKTGFIIPAKDSQAIANAILKIYNNMQLRTELQMNVLATAKSDFSWEEIGKNAILMYHKIKENFEKAGQLTGS